MLTTFCKPGKSNHFVYTHLHPSSIQQHSAGELTSNCRVCISQKSKATKHSGALPILNLPKVRSRTRTQDQGTRGPGDQGTRGPGDQETRRPGPGPGPGLALGPMAQDQDQVVGSGQVTGQVRRRVRPMVRSGGQVRQVVRSGRWSGQAGGQAGWKSLGAKALLQVSFIDMCTYVNVN